MKILLVHTSYRQPGGEDSAVELQMDLLRGLGHEIVLHHATNPTGVASVPALLGAVWNPKAARRLERAVERHRPDLVHIHNTWFAMSPSVVGRARELGVPVVMTLHNFRLACANSLLLRNGQPCTNCVGRDPRDAIRYRCYRGLAGSSLAAAHIAIHTRRGTWTHDVSRFIVMSEFARSVVVRHGLPADKISLVPQATNDPGPRPAPPSESDYFLFVGRLSHEKGLDLALKAWRLFAHPDLEFRIIGDGPLRALAEDSGIRGVRYVGRLPRLEVRQAMLKARTIVIPSICFEAATPLVAIESMSAGAPFVGAMHGGVKEAVESVSDQLGFAPNDPRSLVDRLQVLSTDIVDRLGRRARTVFEDRHSPTLLARSLDDMYRIERRP